MLSRTTLFSRLVVKAARGAGVAMLCVAALAGGSAQALEVETKGKAVYISSSGNLAKYDEEGHLIWSRPTKTGGDLALDPAGYPYVAARTGTLGKYNGFISKLSLQGAVLWSRVVGTPKSDYVESLATDASGNLYVVGYTNGSLQGRSLGQADTFVRKYSPAGAVLWTRQLGTPHKDYPFGAATDSHGNVFIAGTTRRTVAGHQQQNMFLIKLDKNGGELWRQQFGSSRPGTDYGAGLVVDSAGAAIVVGFTYGAFDGFVNDDRSDIFLRKYSSDGAVLQTEQFGPPNVGEVAYAVTLDSSDNLYIAGRTDDCIKGPCAHPGGMLVRKYSSAGDIVWTRQSVSQASGSGIAVPASGKIYVTFGLWTGNHYREFLRRLDAKGEPVWTKEIKWKH